MTKPQDKMRAEFEAHHAERFTQPMTRWGETYANAHVRCRWDGWQAACAQQSAQASQDALDAARYRWLRDHSSTRDGMTDCQAVARLVGFTQFPTLTMESRVHDPDSAIDALIAAQGASNV